MVSILAVCDCDQGNAKRMCALVLLLRYSGLRIGDAVRLARDWIKDRRLFLYTQKTGVPVWCPLPDFVITALESFEPMNNTYYFWSGESSRDGIARSYMGRLSRVFTLAGVKGGHAHRFRDTFATELLLSGVPLGRVSVLLGHRSITSDREALRALGARAPGAIGGRREGDVGAESAGARRNEGYTKGTRKKRCRQLIENKNPRVIRARFA
jgi:integrase